MGLRGRVSLPLLVISLWLSPTPLSAEPTEQLKPAKPLKLMETPRGFLEAASSLSSLSVAVANAYMHMYHNPPYCPLASRRWCFKCFMIYSNLILKFVM